MFVIPVKIKVIKENHLPEYAHLSDSGADCFASLDKEIVLKRGGYVKIPLGFALGLPEGYEMQVRPRSGLAAKNGVFCHFGTVDESYTGEVAAIMFNHSEEDFIIREGTKLCQMVLAPVYKACFVEVDELDETDRGTNGFGSTGI